MKLSAILSCLPLVILTGCLAPDPAGELILTAEDMRLKRTPYRESEMPCGEYMTYSHTAVTYSK